MVSIETHGCLPLGSFNAALPNGITVVCGLNGVGKTTLLRLVASSLSGDRSPLRPDLTASGHFEVQLELDSSTQTHSITEGPPSQPVVFMDASRDCARLLALSKETNFEDLFNGVEPSQWSAESREQAHYVLGKRYNEIRTFEIEDPTGDEDQLPAIFVESEGVSYDFRTMGLGEFAALVTLWRLEQTPSGSVVLLEEPETYLSARGSVALLDVLAASVDKSRLYSVVTTHSPGIMASVPTSQLLILSPGADGLLELRPPESLLELDYLLGLPATTSHLVLAEDETARLVLEELLARFGGSAARPLRILVTEGYPRLLEVCKSFPVTDAVSLVGVLDGDQSAPDSSRWPVLVLPWHENPDDLLRGVILDELDDFAGSISRGARQVRSAASIVEGVDEHDWFVDFSAGLHVHPGVVRRAGLDLLLAHPAQKARAEAFVRGLFDACQAGPDVV